MKTLIHPLSAEAKQTNKLEQLNSAQRKLAEAWFRNCCGSREWARIMAESRPFERVAELLDRAERTWWSLGTEDWLEAFAAHPKIGARKGGPHQPAQSAQWSNAEQSGMQSAAEAVRDALAEANRLYEEKFGYIFIVCATGKSAEEMLAICRGRLKNAFEEEIRIAAEEQKKITEIRLKKLLKVENA